jgi:hypothetical protein
MFLVVMLEVSGDVVGVCGVCFMEKLWVSDDEGMNGMEWNGWGMMFS